MDSTLGLISIKTLVFYHETPEFKQMKYGKWSEISLERIPELWS